MCYTHKDHAGNAGDVWKHFILVEVAEYLLSRQKKLAYVESHVGFPEYPLRIPGEWQDGIGKFWSKINDLRSFSYFRILDLMNPVGLQIYPGSATLIFELAKKDRFVLEADIWDVNPEVSSSWHEVAHRKSEKLQFHLGDGFSGVRSLIDGSKPTLLMIDPPYLEKRDIQRSTDLFEEAAISGWTVLLWQMIDSEVVPDDLLDRCEYNYSIEKYFMNFSEVGLRRGKWLGAAMILGGSLDLQHYVSQRVRDFLELRCTGTYL